MFKGPEIVKNLIIVSLRGFIGYFASKFLNDFFSHFNKNIFITIGDCSVKHVLLFRCA